MANYLDKGALEVIRDWVRSRSLRVKEITQEAYDAMTDEEKKTSDILWVIPDSTTSGGSSGRVDIPKGVIVMWSGAEADIPDGWALCDGQNGTPNLVGRFVLGAGSGGFGLDYSVGDTGGEETVTLTVAQMPSHTHSYRTMRVKCDTKLRNKLPNKLPYPFGVILPQPALLVTAGWEACGTTWES